MARNGFSHNSFPGKFVLKKPDYMEQYLTMEVLVRVPKHRNLKRDLSGNGKNSSHRKKFTVANMWHLQKVCKKRRPRRNIFI